MAAGRRGRRLLARAAGTGRRRARPGRPRRGFDSARASARTPRTADLRRTHQLAGRLLRSQSPLASASRARLAEQSQRARIVSNRVDTPVGALKLAAEME